MSRRSGEGGPGASVRSTALVVAVLAVAVAALVAALAVDDRSWGLVTLAAVTVVGVVALGVRLRSVYHTRSRHERAALVLRDAALDLAAARELAGVRSVAMRAVLQLAGPEVEHVAWLVANGRSAVSPLEILGSSGPLRREDVNLDGVLARLHGLEGGLARTRDDAGHSMVVVPVPAQSGVPSALAVTTEDRMPDAVLESLVILGTQTALAADSLLQAQELAHKRSEARFQQLVRHSRDAVFIVGWDGRVRYQSPSVVKLLGYLAVDLDGTLIRRIVHPDDAAPVEALIETLVQSPLETSRSVEVQLVRADDSIIHAEVVGLNLLENPDVNGLVLTVRDISGRRLLEDQLRHQAFHDPLTGLANRALFSDRVEHALNRVRREDTVSPVVALIDLDDFKLVNDSLGHAAGDELLRQVAERLRLCLRSGDTPARLGGDEFAVLLEDGIDAETAVEVAERILDALDTSVTISGREVFVKASIGVATRVSPDMTLDELLRNADLAMYTAKANGKGCVEVFSHGMHVRVADRLALRSDLERAVDRHEIGVVYQPVVRLLDGEVVGFEALSRWVHPVRGSVSPAEFIPVAEDTGSILALGRFVLEEACRQLSAWTARRPHEGWTMSVNVSATQLLDAGVVDMVRAVLEDSGLDASQLVLELTESVLVADNDQVLRRLHQLKDLGVQIAIDDFGTGYSSLHHLQRVPFDIVKIDRVFVSALRHEDPAATLVRTIMDLTRTLGRRAVAEGVEERIEMDGLVQLGCELAQGFYLARPAPAAALEADLGLTSASA